MMGSMWSAFGGLLLNWKDVRNHTDRDGMQDLRLLLCQLSYNKFNGLIDHYLYTLMRWLE